MNKNSYLSYKQMIMILIIFLLFHKFLANLIIIGLLIAILFIFLNSRKIN